MKKLLSLILCVILLVTMVSCNIHKQGNNIQSNDSSELLTSDSPTEENPIAILKDLWLRGRNVMDKIEGYGMACDFSDKQKVENKTYYFIEYFIYFNKDFSGSDMENLYLESTDELRNYFKSTFTENIYNQTIWEDKCFSGKTPKYKDINGKLYVRSGDDPNTDSTIWLIDKVTIASRTSDTIIFSVEAGYYNPWNTKEFISEGFFEIKAVKINGKWFLDSILSTEPEKELKK